MATGADVPAISAHAWCVKHLISTRILFEFIYLFYLNIEWNNKICVTVTKDK